MDFTIINSIFAKKRSILKLLNFVWGFVEKI